MLDLLIEYGFFLLKVVTVIGSIFLLIALISNANRYKKLGDKGQLVIKNLSEKLENMGRSIQGSQMDPKSFKKLVKESKKAKKKKLKSSKDIKQAVFVLNFKGDIQASGVSKLKQEINAILSSETKCKEVVLKVESGGGSAYAYGLCAAELKRLVDDLCNNIS